jgi:hypothetical protein
MRTNAEEVFVSFRAEVRLFWEKIATPMGTAPQIHDYGRQ